MVLEAQNTITKIDNNEKITLKEAFHNLSNAAYERPQGQKYDLSQAASLMEIAEDMKATKGLGSNGIITYKEIERFYKLPKGVLPKDEESAVEFLYKNFNYLKNAGPGQPEDDYRNEEGISRKNILEAAQVFEGLAYIQKHPEMKGSNGNISANDIEKYIENHPNLDPKDVRALQRLEYYESIPGNITDAEKLAKSLFKKDESKVPEKVTASPETDAERITRETQDLISLYQKGMVDEDTAAERLVTIKHRDNPQYRVTDAELQKAKEQLRETSSLDMSF